MDDKQKTGNTPLDPTQNAAELMGDTSGLTGITVNNTHSGPVQGKGSVANTQTASGNQTQDPTPSDPALGISDTMKARAEDVATDEDKGDTPGMTTPEGHNLPLGGNLPSDDSLSIAADPDSNLQQRIMTPSMQGEQSVSGDMPHPESDDDTLANAQAMGMQLDEDPEHPQELDIARDIDNAEESLRST